MEQIAIGKMELVVRMSGMDGVLPNVCCPTRVEIVGVNVVVRKITVVVCNQVVIEPQVVWVVNQPTIPQAGGGSTAVIGERIS